MSANINLFDALHLTWNRIHQPEFSEQLDNLYDNLIYELADSATVKLKTQCASGICSRIIDTLVCIDDNIQIKPKWALRRELYSAQKMYQDLIKMQNQFKLF